MSRLAAAAVGFLAVLHVAVLTAPAIMLAGAARKGGLPWAHGLDLVAVSTLIGLVHGGIVQRRLGAELRSGDRPIDAAIAAVDALVVAGLLSTAFVYIGLGGLAPEHAAVLNKGWHVLASWAVLQLVAVAVAEQVRTGMLVWLERARRRAGLADPGPPPPVHHRTLKELSG